MEQPNLVRRELERAGLSGKAAAIYAYLLQTGGGYPSRIAAATSINRSTTYKILTELSIKGLVNEIEKGKKLFYQIERPAKLLRYARRQADMAEEAFRNLESFYPQIESLYGQLPDKPRMRYLEGEEAVHSIYDDHIGQKKPYEMLGFANTPDLLHFIGDEYFKKYRHTKECIGITTRGILPEGKLSEEYATVTYADISPKFRPELHFIPQDQFPLKGEITIYGTDRVSIMNLEEGKVAGIIIEDASFHAMMRVIFDLAWKSAEPAHS